MRFRIGGAAIHTAEIAAVRDRNAQVGDSAPEFVSEQHAVFAPAKQKAQIRTWNLGYTPDAKNKRQTFPFPSTGGPGVSARTLSSATREASPTRP